MVPAAPNTLVQNWVQHAYDELVGKRHWAWMKKQAVLTTLAERDATVTFTQGSTAITSVGEFVVATDPGRQIRVGTGPIYTIDTVASVNAATLTLAYAETSGASTASIHDRYLVMPADFRSFYDISDMSLQRPIAWWVSQELLDGTDPGRTRSDSRFRVLASYQLSDATAQAGRVLYEAWPQPTAAGSYPFTYFKRMDVLADEDTFKGVLATKIEALIDGALARAARWPGTAERKNPYFSLPLSREHAGRFEAGCQDLNIADDDTYLEDLQQIDLSRYGLGTLSGGTSLLRQSDATLSDYL